MLTEILNEDSTKAIVNIATILGLDGDSEAFIETMPKAGNFLMIHNDKDTFKFLFLTQSAEMINSDDSQARDLCLRQTGLLEKNSKIMQDIAKSYDLKVTAYSEITDNAKKALFMNPTSFTTLMKEPTKMIEKIVQKEIAKPKGQSINLGAHKITNEPSYEPIDYFDKVLVLFGKNETTKEQFTSVIAEEMSLNDVNVLLFTYNPNSENLKYPNNNTELVRQKLSTEPMGFPVATYDISKDGIFCDLSEFPPDAINELYDVGNNVVANIIKTAMTKKPKTLDALYGIIEQMVPTDSITKYDLLLAQRVIETINQIHPELFLGNQDTAFLTTAWKKLGKINIVALDHTDASESKAVVHSLLKKVCKNNAKIAIFLPMASQFIPKEDLDSIEKEILNTAISCKDKYFFLYAPEAADINSDVYNTFGTSIQITQDSDLAIKLKEAKPYRLDLRPTLSKSS